MENTNITAKADVKLTPINLMKKLLSAKGTEQMFIQALKENSGAFISSLIDLYNSDTTLQQCEPKDVIMEALKAATLKLPINKQLGFAYIVPYNQSRKVGNEWVKETKPNFQLGYKGYIQLAMRTGQYKNLNSGIIYEGMDIEHNYLAGTIEIHGEKKSDIEIGYFAYLKLNNGFEKCLYMSKEEIEAHAKKFSKTFEFKGSSWQSNFSSMALKTVTRLLLSKYGVLSVEMQEAITKETDEELQQDIEQNANKKVIDVAEYQNEVVVDVSENKEESKAPF